MFQPNPSFDSHSHLSAIKNALNISWVSMVMSRRRKSLLLIGSWVDSCVVSFLRTSSRLNLAPHPRHVRTVCVGSAELINHNTLDEVERGANSSRLAPQLSMFEQRNLHGTKKTSAQATTMRTWTQLESKILSCSEWLPETSWKTEVRGSVQPK